MFLRLSMTTISNLKKERLKIRRSFFLFQSDTFSDTFSSIFKSTRRSRLLNQLRHLSLWFTFDFR